MPVVTIYRSHRSLTSPDGRYAAPWTEYAFEPTAGEHRTASSGWTHWRGAPEPIRVRVPIGGGPRAVRTADGREIVVAGAGIGVGAESVLWRATHGVEGYQLIEEGSEVGRRRDDGPTLFGAGDAPDPGASAYPRAAAPRKELTGATQQVIGTIAEPLSSNGPDPAAERERLRPIVAGLAAEVIAPVVDAVRRAVAQLDRAIGAGDLAGVVTARAILECAIEDAGRRPAA